MKGGKGGMGRSGGGKPNRGGKPSGKPGGKPAAKFAGLPKRGEPKSDFGGRSSADEAPTSAPAPGTVSVQRTLNVPAAAVIRVINDPDRRDWAPERLYRVVSVLAPRFIRLAFPDGSFAAISLARQGNARCTVTVELSKLPVGADERALRERWAYGLAAMQDQLDSSWD